MKPDACRLAIKICGITSLEDATAAIEAGADLLGFNFYPASRRYIQPERCAEIIRELKAARQNAVMVGVFVNAPPFLIKLILQSCGLHLAQLSGDEPAGALAELNGSGYKALHMKDEASLQEALRQYPAREKPPAYLLDAYTPGEYGGTGRTLDWSAAASLAQRVPILLAGGLTPENVRRAVAQVHPWGVDVASGVESAPGKKDPAKMRQFVQAARQAAQA